MKNRVDSGERSKDGLEGNFLNKKRDRVGYTTPPQYVMFPSLLLSTLLPIVDHKLNLIFIDYQLIDITI